MTSVGVSTIIKIEKGTTDRRLVPQFIVYKKVTAEFADFGRLLFCVLDYLNDQRYHNSKNCEYNHKYLKITHKLALLSDAHDAYAPVHPYPYEYVFPEGP